MADNPRTLDLVFVDGNANGIIIAREPGWTAYVLKAPRIRILEALKIDPEKVGSPGVYVLVGENEGKRHAYIGQAENVAERVRQHLPKKSWWENAVLFTMPDDVMNVAHAKYFESRLITEAGRIKKATLDNHVDAALPKIVERERIWLDKFFERFVSIFLPTLGVDDFVDESRVEKPREQERPAGEAGAIYPEGPMVSPIFELEGARARQIADKFVVEKNSHAAKEWQKDPFQSYGPLFNKLKDSHVLEEDGDHRRFSRDYAFNSESAAASVVKGFPCSGPQYWRVKGQNKTLRQWEREQVDAVEGSAPGSN